MYDVQKNLMKDCNVFKNDLASCPAHLKAGYRILYGYFIQLEQNILGQNAPLYSALSNKIIFFITKKKYFNFKLAFDITMLRFWTLRISNASPKSKFFFNLYN